MLVATFWSCTFYICWSINIAKTKQKKCIKWLFVILSFASQRPLWVQTLSSPGLCSTSGIEEKALQYSSIPSQEQSPSFFSSYPDQIRQNLLGWGDLQVGGSGSRPGAQKPVWDWWQNRSNQEQAATGQREAQQFHGKTSLKSNQGGVYYNKLQCTVRPLTCFKANVSVLHRISPCQTQYKQPRGNFSRIL